jgi:hypothetical protein
MKRLSRASGREHKSPRSGKMDMQIQKVYAIDLLGMTNDGIMPSIVFT